MALKHEKTSKEVAEDIVALLKKNGFTIRGYEGEVSGCVIEDIEDRNVPAAFIYNDTMEIE